MKTIVHIALGTMALGMLQLPSGAQSVPDIRGTYTIGYYAPRGSSVHYGMRLTITWEDPAGRIRGAVSFAPSATAYPISGRVLPSREIAFVYSTFRGFFYTEMKGFHFDRWVPPLRRWLQQISGEYRTYEIGFPRFRLVGVGTFFVSEP
jgi:hypothetical protein